MNNQAPELSPEARRLINAARAADDPTADDQARVKARWLASVAAVAGVSSLTEAARAAGGIGWGLKAAGAALVIAAGAIGVNFALDADRSAEAEKTAAPLPGWDGKAPERFQKTPRDGQASEPPAVPALPSLSPPSLSPSSPEPVAATAPGAEPAATTGVSPAPVAAVVAEPVVAEPVELAQPVVAPTEAVGTAPEASSPARAAARTRLAARSVATRASAARAAEKAAPEKQAAPIGVEAPAAPAASNGQLGEELALLSEVRSSVQEGAGTRALELLARYESSFGQPILGMEADALRVDALCKAGQRDAARESARAFQNEWPGSPLERRVSAACP